MLYCRPLLAFLLIAGLSSLPGEEGDLLQGTQQHSELIGRFEQSFDWRLLRFLLGRSGLHAEAENTQRVRALAQASSRQPPMMLRASLAHARIIWDQPTVLAQRRERWQEILGEQEIFERQLDYVQVLGSTASQEVLESLIQAIPLVQAMHSQHFPFPQKVERPLQILVFPNRQLYDAQDFRDQSYATFRPRSGKIAFWIDGQALRRNRNAEMVRLVQVLCHEMWHFYIQYHAPGMPIWMEEGLAEVFESAIVRGTAPLRLGADIINTTNQRVLQENMDAGDRIPLSELMFYTNNQFVAEGQIAYPQAWSVMHFLFFNENEQLAQIPHRIIRSLRQGQDQETAVRAALGNLDWPSIEDLWQKHFQAQRNAPRRGREFAP